MDPQEKQKIEKILELEEENNHLLKKMKRSMFWRTVFNSVYWIVVIGIAVGAYYYIQPFLNKITQTYGSFTEIYDKLIHSGDKLNQIKR